jgi:hypothetical protein
MVASRPFSWVPFAVLMALLAFVGLGLLAVGAFTLSWAMEWERYASLPLTALSELGRLAPGSLVRVEGQARSQPELPPTGSGARLALQRVRFTHRSMGSTGSPYTDYERTLPEAFLLGSGTPMSSSGELMVFTAGIRVHYCLLQAERFELGGSPAEVEQRIRGAISPAFRDNAYVRGSRSELEVTSLAQGAAATVCGILERSERSERSADPLGLRALSLSRFTGAEFVTRAHAMTFKDRAAATELLAIGGLLLALDAWAVCLLRRRRRRIKSLLGHGAG